MILEGLVTTTAADGLPHLAPMGPTVGPDMRTFVLWPFPTSSTYQNLRRLGEGVLHVTDDVLLLSRAAVGKATPFPPCHPARAVRGFVLDGACRSYEFRVVAVDDSEPRVRIEAVVVAATTHRDFFGFNRAKHAVLEAAILATRFAMLPADEIAAEFRRLRVIVDKTAGPGELEAMAFLETEWVNFQSGDRP